MIAGIISNWHYISWHYKRQGGIYHVSWEGKPKYGGKMICVRSHLVGWKLGLAVS